jgi:transposase
MPQLLDILNRLRSGEKKKTIAREMELDVKMIRRFASCAEGVGWLASGASTPSEKVIHETYYARRAQQKHMLDAYREYIASLVEDKKKDSELTIEGIYRLLKEKIFATQELSTDTHGAPQRISESMIRRYIKKHFPVYRAAKVNRTLEHGIMEVDFGDIGTVFDDRDGVKRNRKVYVFVARLRYSRKMYCEIVLDQKAPTFARAHAQAFDHFGGVPTECVPDNAKAAVIHSAFGKTELNSIYHDLATHYQFKINPCRPYSPNQKGGVENGVKYVKRSCLSVLRRKERELGFETPRLSAIERGLRTWLTDVCDQHKVQGSGLSPNELFESEKSSLREIPFDAWDPLTIATYTVSDMQRVRFDKSSYAVPERYIGEVVEIRAKSKQIRIVFNHEVIAIHERAAAHGMDIVGSVIMGKRHDAYVEHTNEQALACAERIGPQTKAFITIMLTKNILQSRGEAFGIVKTLANKYGATRIEAACARALLYDGAARYSTIKRILEQNLDQASLAVPVNANNEQMFRFMRTIHLIVFIIIF